MTAREPIDIGSRVVDSRGIRYTRFSDSQAWDQGDWINEDGLMKQWSEIDDPHVFGRRTISIFHAPKCVWATSAGRECSCGANPALANESFRPERSDDQ